MFGWIAYLRKNRLLARVEDLEDRVELLHQRLVRRESAEHMRTLRASRAGAAAAELEAEAASIIAGAAGGKNGQGGPKQGQGTAKIELYRQGGAK